MLVGVCVVGTFGVTMVLSQLYLPRHVGMASGLSVGLAMGIGGVAAVVLGAVADAVDLKTALTICAVAPAVGVSSASGSPLRRSGPASALPPVGRWNRRARPPPPVPREPAVRTSRLERW